MSKDFTREYFEGAGCRLSAVDFGGPGMPMVVLHGMRDHGLAMTAVAEAFGDEYRVIAADLRGHGDSDNPGSYAMVQFIADLAALVDHFGLERMVLVGHSLGGHIATKFAGIYPAMVAALVIIDGMGPPRSTERDSREDMQARWRGFVDTARTLRDERRQMKGEEEAVSRLRRNNPGLSEATARLIAHEGVESHPAGGVRWKWDARVQMVWGTFDHDETERQCGFIDCPVLIVTGEHSMQYWSGRGLFAGEDVHAVHDAENRRRVMLFTDARHVEIPDAGHMIHYDQPDRLNGEMRAFLMATG